MRRGQAGVNLSLCLLEVEIKGQVTVTELPQCKYNGQQRIHTVTLNKVGNIERKA